MTMVFTLYRDLAALIPFAVFSLLLALFDELWMVFAVVSLGLLGSAYDPEVLGWSSLLGAVLGWTVGMLKERLFLEYPLSRWLVLWGVLLIVKSAYMLVAVGMDPGLWISSFFAGGLASAGLTATAGLVVSLLWERAKPRIRSTTVTPGSDEAR